MNREVAYAQTLANACFPVLIAGDERSAVPISLITAQWVDGRHDLHQALCRDLRRPCCVTWGERSLSPQTSRVLVPPPRPRLAL